MRRLLSARAEAEDEHDAERDGDEQGPEAPSAGRMLAPRRAPGTPYPRVTELHMRQQKGNSSGMSPAESLTMESAPGLLSA